MWKIEIVEDLISIMNAFSRNPFGTNRKKIFRRNFLLWKFLWKSHEIFAFVKSLTSCYVARRSREFQGYDIDDPILGHFLIIRTFDRYRYASSDYCWLYSWLDLVYELTMTTAKNALVETVSNSSTLKFSDSVRLYLVRC